MGGVNVKNTIVERVLQLIAPHPCSGCAKVGVLLCPDCKNNIMEAPFLGCILCGTPQMSGICPSHTSPITRAFTVSERGGSLETLINRYKFEHVKGAVFPLAELLHEALPLLPADIEIVPIPTVRSHVRERGYDHIELVVRQLASLRKAPITRALVRNNKATQHTVRKEQREAQAKTAFRLDGRYDVTEKTVLLVDDVVTTGATLQAAAKVLQTAGATVWVATLAYQPLD